MRTDTTRGTEDVWPGAPKQLDEALVKVVAGGDDAVYRIRPDDKHALVSLQKYKSRRLCFAINGRKNLQ